MPLNSTLSAMIDGQWRAWQAYPATRWRERDDATQMDGIPDSDYIDWATWDAPGPFPEGGYGTGAGAGAGLPSGAGYGGYYPPPSGGPSGPAPITWSKFGYRPPGAPTWWKAMKPSEATEQSELLASVNMMIPFLSPEDQVQTAALLARSDPDNFGFLNKALSAPPSAELSRSVRERYTGKERILNATQALDRLRGVMGKKGKEMGEGYKYLKQLTRMMGGYTRVDAPQSRLGFQQMAAAVEPMLKQAPSKSYSSIARMLAQPFFSGGQLMPAQKVGGKWLFGEPSKELYG